jgi:hypothetical protein
MYTNVLFLLKTNADKLKVFVEKNELKFNDQGIASIAIVGGQEYFLYCFASGKLGSFYELSILEPKDTLFQIFRKIESSSEDKAKYSFTLALKEQYSAFVF